MMKLLTAATMVIASVSIVSAAPVAPSGGVHAAGGSTAMDDLVGAELRTQDFIHIPGPNPIITVGSNGTWDSSVIECAGGVYSEYDSACVPIPAARPRCSRWPAPLHNHPQHTFSR